MKKEIRKKYLNLRNNINNKTFKDNLIYQKMITNKKIINSETILIYVSTEEEIDTLRAINYFINKKKIAVPKIENNEMNFYYINSLNELRLGYFNILEPNNNNLVTDFTNTVSITPGICFSEEGYRIGYGKGYYDKFYQKHNVYKIGLCYKKCLLNTIPYDKYDRKVDEIITE